jgi:ribonuclease HI
MPNPRLKIFFDGGCQPNPGRMEAAVVARGVTHTFRDLGHGTNNDAEWLALIAALRVAQDLQVADFVLLGDAATVIHQANGTWKCRSSALRVHLAAFEALRGDDPVQIRKVARSQNLAGIALAKTKVRP